MNKLVTILFLIFIITPVKAQYTGGDNDGYGDGILTQSNCPNLTPNFTYFGGINDGAGDGLLTQSNCPNLTINFTYYGGINDGAGDGLLTQSNCPDLTTNFTYYGGINDGAGDGSLTQSNCPDLTPNFTYYGGINDGFGWRYTQPQICTTPLPIELLEFVGTCDDNGIRLNWATASETNNDYFTVERSYDGVNFSVLGKIKGAGNSKQTLHYTFNDKNVKEDIYYYRLKQTDFNGEFKYSKLIAVTCNAEFPQDIMVYPNPTNEIINVITSNNLSNIQIVNNLGEYIMEFKNLNGNNKCALNLLELLPGHYILIINTYQGTFFKSIVKL